MKTIHLEIADNLYEQFKKLLNLLPKNGYLIIEEDSDTLTVEEAKEVYRLNSKLTITILANSRTGII